MPVDRREFLKRAGMLGGAALAASALPGCKWLIDYPGTGPIGTILGRPGSEAPIDHIVVVMMENRSFDHWLGWLADDAAYLDAGRSRWGSGFHVDGAQAQIYLDPGGNPVGTAHLFEQMGQTNPWRGCGFEDPGHGWDAGRAERDGGFLAAGSGNDQFALGYYRGGDLPFSAQLAKRFTTFDKYHASLLGPTYPNREYLHSAQSWGQKTNAFPTDAANGFGFPNIWDKLGAAGVPSRYYYSDLPVIGLWGQRGLGFASPIADYFDACAHGTLPNVTMVDPNFLGPNQCDDHPLADIRAGQRFLRDVFKAFVQSPHWQRGVFIVTYDEWGGFFDHVAPPHLEDIRANANDADDFSQAGFRVPTVMASPYARQGFVDHREYDHTSILRFIEWRFLGAPSDGGFGGSVGDGVWWLTQRDRAAYNLGAGLAPAILDADVGFDLDVPIDPPSPECAPTGAAAFRAQATSARDNAFDPDAWGAYLDRIGARVPLPA